MTEFTSDPEEPPYNTAHLVDDRSHLYHEYDVDRDLDGGVEVDGRVEAPPDYQERRHAVLTFYGHRCGRCMQRLVRGDPGDDESLGYVHSIAADGPRWRLEALVALCEPCYDLLTAESAEDLSEFGRAFADAPQFPQWCCDPRVAVERVPFSGREVWLRERLTERVAVTTTDCGENERVAEDCYLALDTAAATAVALGDELADDHWTRPSGNRLIDRWRERTDAEQAWYDAQAVDVDSVLDGGPDDPSIAFRTPLSDADASDDEPVPFEGGEFR